MRSCGGLASSRQSAHRVGPSLPVRSSSLHAAAGVAYHALAYPPPPSQPQSTRRLLSTLALYAAAVVGDRLDRPIHWLTLGVVSGHTLKHVAAGAAGWQLVRLVREGAPQQRHGGRRE